MVITAAQHLSKIMNAKIAGLAGTGRQQTLVMESIKEFPRGINSDQVISGANATAPVQRAPGPGLKRQASSAKPQAPSFERYKRQASSPKLQASSFKPQASSSRIEDPGKSFKHL